MNTSSKIENLRTQVANIRESIKLAQFTFGHFGSEPQVFVKIHIENKYIKCALPLKKFIEGEDINDLAIRALTLGKIISMENVQK